MQTLEPTKHDSAALMHRAFPVDEFEQFMRSIGYIENKAERARLANERFGPDAAEVVLTSGRW